MSRSTHAAGGGAKFDGGASGWGEWSAVLIVDFELMEASKRNFNWVYGIKRRPLPGGEQTVNSVNRITRN